MVADRDSAIGGAEPFQVSRDEIAEHGLTVRSDVHTVGETLRRLFDAAEDQEPRPDLAAAAEVAESYEPHTCTVEAVHGR